MYFIYNQLSTIIVFNDIGLIIPANDFFELDNSVIDSFEEGSELDQALLASEIVLCTSNAQNPPASSTILTTYQARYILKRKESAFEIAYDDAETQIGAINLQEAIEILVDTGGGTGIEEAPIDGELYGRRNAEWLSIDIAAGATPGGAGGDVQFNTEDVFDASSNFNYDKDINALKVSKLFVMPVGNKVGLWVL